MQTAIFGGGCFWCTEAVFQRLKGVTSVISGYAGGTRDNPTYFLVSEELTGHAEVIQVEFDPNIISYQQLLDIFWDAHDPTTLNRQGADVGTQYRSIILTTSKEQQTIAEKSKQALQETYGDTKVVTEITPLEKFYTAEEYHQNYYNNNKNQPYCSFVIDPKIEKLERKYKHLLK